MLLLLFSAFTTGCGYTTLKPNGVFNEETQKKRLAIGVFDNYTNHVSASAIFTSAAKRQFAASRSVIITDQSPDLILKGSIKSLESRAAIISPEDAGQNIAASDITAELELVLLDKTGIEIRRISLCDNVSQLNGKTMSRTRLNREEAIKRLAEIMMELGRDDILEIF